MSEPLIDVTGRRRLRQREARRRLLRRLGLVAAVLAVAGGLVWLFYGSPLLVVRSVEVRGNTLVSAEEVTAAAAVPLGTPLVQVDDAGILARVGELPAVARLSVERRWPTTLAITVTEREVRLVVARDGGFDWVDADGATFHHTLERPEGTMLARAAHDDPAILAGIVSVANALPATLRGMATEITADTADSITVQLTDGRQVVWGSSEASDLKAQVVTGLLDVKAGVYDVSSPSHPTTRGR